MIILASTPNDKGAQLEQLTRVLLQAMGYTNCTTNVMANGAELDVRGQLPLPTIGQVRYQTLICECKAHKTAIDMTQWCKFLGKVYHQEICGQAEVAGCFIALAGVNGHVQGSYDELRRHRSNISLLHGDDLLQAMTKSTRFMPLSEISRRAQSLTHRTASRFEPAYHNGSLYWIVLFSDGEFTMFEASGSPVTSEDGARLQPMVEAELDVSSFVDVQQEARAQERISLARTIIVATLFRCGGSVDGIGAFAPTGDFSPDELREVAQTLVSEGHLETDAEGKCVLPTSTIGSEELVSPEIYRILFANPFPVDVLDSDFYQRHINQAMLAEISQIQHGLDFTSEDADEIVQLLRLSPSALAQALAPMQMIVAGRDEGAQIESVDQFHRDYFRQAALEALKRDLRTAALACYYYEVRGLRELESRTTLVLKNARQVESEAEFTERIGIGRLVDSLGGGLAHVAMLGQAPQPWEMTVPEAPVRDDEEEETGPTEAG